MSQRTRRSAKENTRAAALRFCTERRREGRQGQEAREQMRIEHTVTKRKRSRMEADTTNTKHTIKFACITRLVVWTVLVLVLADMGVSRPVQSKLGSDVWRTGKVEPLTEDDIDRRGFEGLEACGVIYMEEEKDEWERMVSIGSEDRKNDARISILSPWPCPMTYIGALFVLARIDVHLCTRKFVGSSNPTWWKWQIWAIAFGIQATERDIKLGNARARLM
ncbi:hypothetical protein C8R45DRAFT_921740 [Mycena sanguinolenta]|nr:hypothetical protein C8R45DRAFT_921740 [Mycena sanguinolenta]